MMNSHKPFSLLSFRPTPSHSVALLTLLTFLLISCGNGGDDANANGGADAETKPVYGEWVVVWLLSDPEGLNPVVTSDNSSNAIFNHVYDRLLTQDFKTLELIPSLAESRPTISEDHLTYTFTLKKGITFSDGRPMTTADVLFSYKAVKNPLIIDGASLRNYYNDVKDIVAIDDRTFVVSMSQPYFLAEFQLGGMWIMPKHVLDPKNLTDKYTFAETNDLDAAQRNKACREFADWYNTADVKRGIKQNVGSGPYVFDSWATGEAVIIKRNDKWWNKGQDNWNPSYADKIIYKVVNDRNTAVVALKNQELDFMENVPPPKFTEEVDTVAVPHLSKFPFEYHVYLYIGWNTENPVLSDKLVRKALSHLVDRDALIVQVQRGLGKPTNSPVYPNSPEYDNTIQPVTYDPAKARQLLTQAGWGDANNDGFLDKEIGGKRVDLTFKFLLNAGNELREQIALILVDEFRKVGIKAQVQNSSGQCFSMIFATGNSMHTLVHG